MQALWQDLSEEEQCGLIINPWYRGRGRSEGCTNVGGRSSRKEVSPQTSLEATVKKMSRGG